MINPQKRKSIESIITITKGLNFPSGPHPKLKFVESREDAALRASRIQTEIGFETEWSIGDKLDKETIKDALGLNIQADVLSRTINRAARAGAQYGKVFITKSFSRKTKTNQLVIYYQIDWEKFDEMDYLFECRDVLMSLDA